MLHKSEESVVIIMQRIAKFEKVSFEQFKEGFIDCFGEKSEDEIVTALSKYKKEDVLEGISEVKALKEEGLLFTEDEYEEYVTDFKQRKTVVKALCLHIAHDCNLACKYCFAGEGEYNGDRSLMSIEVGKKAIDFLVANSGNRVNLEVDFFGGEPLMNFQVVKEIVAYGRSLEEKHNKKFRFTLTTNGMPMRLTSLPGFMQSHRASRKNTRE